MANVMYDSAKKLFLDGDIDLLNDTIKVALIDTNDVSFSSGHDFHNDISAAIVGTPVALGTKTTTAGSFDSADPTFSAVTGDVCEALVIYKDTGNTATSPLIMWYDTGVTGLPVTPNCGDITITVHASGWFTL